MKTFVVGLILIVGTFVYAESALAWGSGGGGGPVRAVAPPGAAVEPAQARRGRRAVQALAPAPKPVRVTVSAADLPASGPLPMSIAVRRPCPPATLSPGDTSYPQASPRTNVIVTQPATGTVVVTPRPSGAVVVAPPPSAVVVTPGACVIVPTTPLICPGVNPTDPRRC
jgi:hypothetical protein